MVYIRKSYVDILSTKVIWLEFFSVKKRDGSAYVYIQYTREAGRCVCSALHAWAFEGEKENEYLGIGGELLA